VGRVQHARIATGRRPARCRQDNRYAERHARWRRGQIAFLKQYLALPSTITATEFHIVYHDNAAGLAPGPSDWDIQAMIKVAPGDIPRWTTGMQRIAAQDADLGWIDALRLPEARWATTSQPTVYIRAQTIVVVFEREGVVARR
jgi:hypothetical protein